MLPPWHPSPTIAVWSCSLFSLLSFKQGSEKTVAVDDILYVSFLDVLLLVVSGFLSVALVILEEGFLCGFPFLNALGTVRLTLFWAEQE